MEDKKRKMRKRNMKIFPIYKRLAWDYLFFYTIDFLFLTQVKNIEASDIVLKSTAYAFFSIIMQIPANIIIEFLGRKNSIVLGNILNCIYMVIIMASKNLGDIIFAEFIGAVAFAIKNMAEPSILNESIPPSRYKGEIYSKISGSGAAGYYTLNAISKIIAGYIFMVNPYLPIILSLIILVVVVILSMKFIEPLKKSRKSINELIGKNQLKDIKSGFAFVLKSERLKSLILCAALIASLLTVLSNYYVSLFQDLNLTSFVIGIIAAIGCLISAFASKGQYLIQSKLKNKTLVTMAIMLSGTTIVAGLFGIIPHDIIIFIVILMFLSYQLVNGLYYTLIDKYLRNFTNAKIDTKIFATSNLFVGIFRVIAGLFASFLLGRSTTAICMIIIGSFFTILYILVGKYMEERVGLKPEQYSEIERKYDELK